MVARICDACGKVLKEKDIQKGYSWDRYFELCNDCKEKFDKLDKEYTDKDNELREKQKEVFENYKKSLKEIGIDYE